jgi:hypothetical protein
MPTKTTILLLGGNKTGNGSVSKMENQTDMCLSTIRKYIEAMGGELAIVARSPEGSIKVEKIEGLEI